MAKAYICDRCKDAETGEAYARVFLELHTPVPHARGSTALGGDGSSKLLARYEDLCETCTEDIRKAIEQRPPRVSP